MKKTAYQLAPLLLCLWSMASPARDRDLSLDLQSTLQRGVNEGRLLQALRPYHVVFVSGYLSNVHMRPRWVGRTVFASGRHFNDQITWLTQHGITNHRVELNTEATVLQNAGTIAQDLRAIPRPILLITHSKGGVDVLHMLVSWPTIRPKIAGWLALQAPFHGTPIADITAGQKLLRSWIYPTLDLLGGSRESVGQLTSETTTNYLMAHSREISTILDQIPTLCFGSHKPDTRGLDTSLEVTRNLMLRLGVRNDGLVPEASAILPGADYAKLDGIDHTAPVTDKYHFRYPRVALTQALVSLLMSNGGL